MDLFRPDRTYEFSYLEKKSKFISFFTPLDDIDELVKYINIRKKLHHKARHHPYAAVLPDYQKYSDDGEPSGTAGQPILTNLQTNQLTNCLIIVSRYFGGIKLGKGGLSRAFSLTSQEVISKAKLLKAYQAVFLRITADYPIHKDLKKFLENFNVLHSQENFSEKVIVEIAIPADDLTNFTQQIHPLERSLNLEILREKLIFREP